jgi:hypothetical protein
MAPQAGKCFNRTSMFTDLHDSVQGNVGNATCVNEFLPFLKVPEKSFAEILL